ncbi:MAG: hypothetical protein ACI8Z1_002150 [Candidatus Azotimanducaceae bacterium]|jgi:hypothetical protein
MDELLKKIDRDLISLEELLLLEIRRLRQQDTNETYSPIEQGLKREMKISFNTTVKTLEGSGGWSNLSLKSFEQEWIEDRLKVVRNLLVRKLPTAFLALSHEEHKQTRKSGFTTGGHQASVELAILDEQVGLHHVEGQSIDQVLQDRAKFNSTELTHGHATAKEKRAQSSDDIRKKLEGKSGLSGTSSFASRDVSSLNDTISDMAREKIAQSPDEIRRKLQEKGSSESQGASLFAAKELSSSKHVPAAKPFGKVAQSPDEIRRKLAERQAFPSNATSKAVFGSKDLSDPNK